MTLKPLRKMLSFMLLILIQASTVLNCYAFCSSTHPRILRTFSFCDNGRHGRSYCVNSDTPSAAEEVASADDTGENAFNTKEISNNGRIFDPVVQKGSVNSGLLKKYPFETNLIISSSMKSTADLIAQIFVAGTPLDLIDWRRNFLFFVFGFVYNGFFRYFYAVKIFDRIFDVDKFTSQSWAQKLRDWPGIRAMCVQTALDQIFSVIVFLPTFYVLNSIIFSGSTEPLFWMRDGLSNCAENLAKDASDIVKIWVPVDLVIFSVPLYLRLHLTSFFGFMFAIYFSAVRGGH